MKTKTEAVMIPVTLSDLCEATEMRCPACNMEYTQTLEPFTAKGNDNYESGWGVRGDVLVIPMECENGHSWELGFGFHKGGTYPMIRNIQEKADV